MEAYWWWLVVAVLAAVVEVVSFGLITVWFVAGALVSFAIAFFGGPLWLQLVAFLVVSLACLFGLRPLALKYRERGKHFEATPVGQHAVVVEEIGGGQLAGRVETGDRVTWVALSSTGEPLETGAHVRVVKQESIKLIVERIS